MKNSKIFKSALGIVLLIVCSAIGSGQTSRHTISSNDAIRKADQDWLRVFAAKDLTKSVDFVIAGGAVLAPNAPIATGHEAIGKLFEGFFSIPELKIEWHPSKVEAARSGELGYSTGAYQMTFKDTSG